MIKSTCCTFLLHFPSLPYARYNLSRWLTMPHQTYNHVLHSLETLFPCHDSPTTKISKMTADPLDPGSGFFLHKILLRHKWSGLSSLDFRVISCWWIFLGNLQCNLTRHRLCLLYFGGRLCDQGYTMPSCTVIHLTFLYKHLLADFP